MSKSWPDGDYARSEVLLDLARYWRNCAAQSNEPWRSDMMLDTAEEFERAAADAIRRTRNVPRGGILLNLFKRE
jgi:hypothetical protein